MVFMCRGTVEVGYDSEGFGRKIFVVMGGQFSNLACLCEAIRVINDHVVSDHKVTYKNI